MHLIGVQMGGSLLCGLGFSFRMAVCWKKDDGKRMVELGGLSEDVGYCLGSYASFSSSIYRSDGIVP